MVNCMNKVGEYLGNVEERERHLLILEFCYGQRTLASL